MSNYYQNKDGPEDINDFPLLVRISARRAILHAQVQAKITNGAKPMRIICQFTPSASLSKGLDQDAD